MKVSAGHKDVSIFLCVHVNWRMGTHLLSVLIDLLKNQIKYKEFLLF